MCKRGRKMEGRDVQAMRLGYTCCWLRRIRILSGGRQRSRALPVVDDVIIVVSEFEERLCV